jgi:hypothetical protein
MRVCLCVFGTRPQSTRAWRQGRIRAYFATNNTEDLAALNEANAVGLEVSASTAARPRHPKAVPRAPKKQPLPSLAVYATPLHLLPASAPGSRGWPRREHSHMPTHLTSPALRPFPRTTRLPLSPLLSDPPSLQAHGERFEYFPDDGTPELGPKFHGAMRGDTRAAMSPFLAHA